ncbi:hypothetical protein Cni_G26936 [Canna indica]|uniref:Protein DETOXIFICATION n=1 Tax=Canna indica TaxID=4628 RepID=A0AAQ3L414_9LILI|nr:hypothetical protein Cni_G26936 [Canna indica]
MINGWEFMVFFGFNVAISVRISNELGAGRPRAAKFAIICVMTSSVTLGVIFFSLVLALRDVYGIPFTNSPEVVRAVSSLAAVFSLVLLLNSVQPVLTGVAVGAGWQWLVAYINMGCYYVIGIPVGCLLAFYFDFGVKILWAMMHAPSKSRTVAENGDGGIDGVLARSIGNCEDLGPIVRLLILHSDTSVERDEMREGACRTLPIATALAGLIDRCYSMRQLQQIHAQIIVAPLSPHAEDAAALLTRLLSSYVAASSSSSSSSLHYPTALFHSLPAPPTLFAYNAIIRAHSFAPSSHLNSISLYSQMLAASIRPDHLTFPFLFKYCSHVLNSAVGQCLHVHALCLGYHTDVYIQNSIIHMYSTCGLIDSARKVFNGMPLKDVVSRNSMLAGHLKCGELDLALDLFFSMTERNVITWNSIITGFVQAGRFKEALDLFHEMLILNDKRSKPDKVTVASIISACSSLGALDQGKWVHAYLKKERLEFDVVVGTALIDMYGKCGCVGKAIEARRFEDVKKIRSFMEEYGIKKTAPGCSTTEVEGQLNLLWMITRPSESAWSNPLQLHTLVCFKIGCGVVFSGWMEWLCSSSTLLVDVSSFPSEPVVNFAKLKLEILVVATSVRHFVDPDSTSWAAAIVAFVSLLKY